MVSREVNNHPHFKKRLETLGFLNVTITALERDALNALIREMKPDLLLMGASFYDGCTPFLMGILKKSFPQINMAALCIGWYPADLAMYFIVNGVKSYVSTFDGMEQWYEGLEAIRKGKEFISQSVLESLEKRRVYPMPAGNITDTHLEVTRLTCCGLTENEIADSMHISRRTVSTHKTEIYRTLNVRNPVELMRNVLFLKIFKLEDLFFYPKDFTLSPLPDKKEKKRRKVK